MTELTTELQYAATLARNNSADDTAAVLERAADELERRFGIGGELIAARRERDALEAENALLKAAVTGIDCFRICGPYQQWRKDNRAAIEAAKK